ncbi:hypothetical protein [Hymenobacter sp. PAMC 26628]|uniref:hypothetical protein n=1 Tax=Hymenobacter sp. PAMC 26628 TaxID=1484118 RepID=UPI00076FE49F|nr:hypothetical protein [Hymenobacter sp. PAMC 26628]AMJ66597.1 hypothetical protein AXW84_15060 [Hymenobacter sp. PAMC 26628]
MKHLSTRGLALALPLLAALAGGCKKELDTYYTAAGAPGFASIALPGLGVAARYAVGETIPITLGYNAADQLQSVRVYQVVNKADSATVGTYPAMAGTYNAATATTVQPVPYVVPNVANGLPVRVDVISTFANGGTQLRRFTYTVAQAATFKFGATPATYRNGLAAPAQSGGDVVGYSVVLNEGGLGAVPVAPATGQLFKAVDSLTTFYRLGSGTPVRVAVIRNPSNGAANARTIDVTLPRNAAGQAITYSFVAYAAVQALTITAPPIALANPTPLATVRTGRLSGGPSATPDSLAFNLRTGALEPATNPPTAKDLYVSGVSGSVLLSAANTTRYYKATAAQVAAGFYTNPTANNAGTTFYLNTAATSANLGAVTAGDVFAVKVRGAELMLLRILAVRPSTAGSTARVSFEYRSL